MSRASRRVITPAPLVVDATVAAPGSKSHSNRALVCAALADGTSALRGLAAADDTRLLRSALGRLGVCIEDRGDRVRVTGRAGRLAPCEGTLDLDLAGTSLRFTLALLAGTEGTDAVITGNARMRERPVADLVEALRGAGADLEYRGRDGCPPVAVRGVRLRGGRIPISGATSSQFASALLLAAPLFDGGLELELAGPVRSASYLELTVEVLVRFGIDVAVEDGGRHLRVPARARGRAVDLEVEGDASGAGYLWAIAALTGGRVRVTRLPRDSRQGDLGLVDLLERMGCRVARSDDAAEVQGPPAGASLRAVDADLERLPDAAQTLAVVAACAAGESTLRGLSTLRHKETDRVAALERELGRVGITARARGDALTVVGGEPGAGEIDPSGDHRMAMSFAALGARVPGIAVRDPEVVSKSYPDFWQRIAELGVENHAG